MSEVDNILSDWGLESLAATFRENKIDINFFKKLTPTYIARLIPTVADQMIFEERWNLKYSTSLSPAKSNATASSAIANDGHLTTLDNKKNNSPTVCLPPSSHKIMNTNKSNVNSAGIDLSPANERNSRNIEENKTEKKRARDVPKKLRFDSDSDVDGEKKSELIPIDTDIITESDSDRENRTNTKKLKKVVKESRNKQKKSHAKQNTVHRPLQELGQPIDTTGETDSESDSALNLTSELRIGGKRKAFYEHKKFEKRIKEEATLSVENILKATSIGRLLLIGYKKTNELSPKQRRVLVDLVISAFVIDENSVIKPCQYDRLSKEIVELFTTECVESYYIPAVPKHVSRLNKSEIATGKLVDKYRNKIREYRSIAGISKGKPRYPENTSTVQVPLTNDVEASIQWLKHNRDAPFKDVLHHWERTTQYRWNKLKGSQTSIADHFKEWPNLEKSDGYKFLEAEFRLMWKEHHNVIYTKWAQFYDKIRKLRLLTNPTSQLLENILDDKNSSENCKILAQLLLLPYYVPPKGRIQRKRQHWKPSITECQESIIIHVKEVGDINTVQQLKVDQMAKFGLTVQPYILAVGPTLQEANDIYVAINQTLYKLESPLKAFDICFKSFHVLNALYPPQSEHIYLLIQSAVYEFATEWDKKISYVMEIVKQLK